jgi:hypothetical protein
MSNLLNQDDSLSDDEEYYTDTIRYKILWNDHDPVQVQAVSEIKKLENEEIVNMGRPFTVVEEMMELISRCTRDSII